MALPQSPTVHRYGRHRAQFAELYRPDPGTTRRPGTVVVIHGGFWRALHDCALGRPLALDLAARGWAAWNVEYRRVGNGGGWPATFLDVAAAIDALGQVPDLELGRVAAVGHSAGGHLAAWAAGRGRLAAAQPGSAPQVTVTSVIAQAGVLCLAEAARRKVGGTAATDLMGGHPDGVPDRFAAADPIAQVPIAASVLCVHSRTDESVPYWQSEEYVSAASAAGADARLIEVPGEHMALVDVTAPAWAVVTAQLPGLLGET